MTDARAAVHEVRPVPFRVETPADFEVFAEPGGMSLVRLDGDHDPALVWVGEDDEWHGVRPVSEGDGPWENLPESVRQTLGFPITRLAPDDDEDESFAPFTVLWHDSLPAGPGSEDLRVIDAAHLAHHRQWADATFGPQNITGVLSHLRKELVEVEANPSDVTEWADVLTLAFGGATRAGHAPQDVIDAIHANQTRNEARIWPDMRTADPNKAIEHVRTDAPDTDAGRLDQLEALANDATDGPWVLLDLDETINGETVTGHNEGWWWVWREAALPFYGGVLEADTDYTVADANGRIWHVDGAIGEAKIAGNRDATQEKKDAAFIAATRHGVPWLVQQVREKDAEIARLRREVTDIIDNATDLIDHGAVLSSDLADARDALTAILDATA